MVTAGGGCVCREGGGSEDGGGLHTARSVRTCWQDHPWQRWSSANSPAGWSRQHFLLQGLQWDTGLLFPITLLLGRITLKPALVPKGAPLQQVGVHGMGDGSPGTRGKSPAPCQGLPHVTACHPLAPQKVQRELRVRWFTGSKPPSYRVVERICNEASVTLFKNWSLWLPSPVSPSYPRAGGKGRKSRKEGLSGGSQERQEVGTPSPSALWVCGHVSPGKEYRAHSTDEKTEHQKS